jgi:hypothetical protein
MRPLPVRGQFGRVKTGHSDQNDPDEREGACLVEACRVATCLEPPMAMRYSLTSMSRFGPRLDELVRVLIAEVIRVAEVESRKTEAKRKAEAHAGPLKSTERVSRVSTSHGGGLGVRLLTTSFEHPDRNGHRVVLTRFAPASPNVSFPLHSRVSRLR